MNLGRVCDKDGNEIPPDSPPPSRDSDRGPNDWSPYQSRVEFELADFLYRRSQMSASNIDTLLNLWGASAATHGQPPPFQNHEELYKTIDSTPLGDVEWECFSMRHNGEKPEGTVPSWMEADYDVWFRDPRKLLHNLISNPDFKDEFDYAPFQERDSDETRRYQDFMSGNWAWRHAVSTSLFYRSNKLSNYLRIG